MEPVVYEETPLAEYLRDGGHAFEEDWAPVGSFPAQPSPSISNSSPPSSPSFAPRGRPSVKRAVRAKTSSAARSRDLMPSPLQGIRRKLSSSIAASIDRAENATFLEQFRYTIVASQLLSDHAVVDHRPAATDFSGAPNKTQARALVSTEGIAGSVLGILAVAVVMGWVRGAKRTWTTRMRLTILLALLAASAFLAQVYLRRQKLRPRRSQALLEISSFVTNSRKFDKVVDATLSLIQEVELVSRGYRIGTPLGPASRLEDRRQGRRCRRLRKALSEAFATALDAYRQALSVITGYSEQIELEKYHDMYDISDFDMADALQGLAEEMEDGESLRSLKVQAARFHTTRKLLLCVLLALDAERDCADLSCWSCAVDTLRCLNALSRESCGNIQGILCEEETFTLPATPKGPMTPGKERWRSQLRKLNSLSSGIRGLQAKLHLLREESDRALDDSSDISALGPTLISQYESIGMDLKELMEAWEEGKAALDLGIGRNEKRLSSVRTVFSPTNSLSGGFPAVSESGSHEALKALTGESSSSSSESAEAEAQEIFEAVARPRPRTILTREQKAHRNRENESRAKARQQAEATQGMLRELETVINLRPKMHAKSPPVPPSQRIVSLNRVIG